MHLFPSLRTNTDLSFKFSGPDLLSLRLVGSKKMFHPPRFFKSRCPIEITVIGSASRKTTTGLLSPDATAIDLTKAPSPEIFRDN